MGKLSLQYIAGFFDGEGSIGVYKSKNKGNTYCLRSQLTQNVSQISENILSELKSRFGGNYGTQNTSSGKKKFNWQLNGPEACEFLEKITPFLVLKKQQSEIAINWQKAKPKQQRNKDNGRILPLDQSFVEYTKDVASTLKSLKP